MPAGLGGVPPRGLPAWGAGCIGEGGGVAPAPLRLWGVIWLGGAGGLAVAVAAVELTVDLPVELADAGELVGAELVGTEPGAPGMGAALRLAPPLGGAPPRVQSKGLLLKRLTWGALAMG
jgi:hypothetical protein